jgi:ankyrin repeat protein
MVPKKKPVVRVPTGDRMGRDALVNAAIDGRTAEAIHLLDAGANPRTADNGGWTALHFAARQHNAALVRALLAHGALLDAQDAHGNTPLFRAVFNAAGRAEVVQLLVEAGADKELKNRAGTSAGDLARRIGGPIAAFFGERVTNG